MCDCTIEHGHGHDTDAIDYCPLHAAAERMRQFLLYMDDRYNREDHATITSCDVREIRAILHEIGSGK